MTEEIAEDRKSAAGKLVVRCGVSRTLCVLQSKDDHPYGTKVIAKTPRGLEVGEVLCPATAAAVQHLDNPPRGQVIRCFSESDACEEAKLQELAETEFKTCERVVAELRLEMQLVDVEHLFGGERIVVYYLAESRVDFRELVRRLASEFRTRVEMRQIGVRDEAKLLADYGDCGKPVCCNTHLTKMPPVSMKMAKLQRSTLDPTKISGRCGRLKCCLRYEFETYEELAAELPPVGSEILTRQGGASVLAQDILSQQLMVRMEDKRRILIGVDQVVRVTKAPPPPKPRRGGRKN